MIEARSNHDPAKQKIVFRGGEPGKGVRVPRRVAMPGGVCESHIGLGRPVWPDKKGRTCTS